MCMPGFRVFINSRTHHRHQLHMRARTIFDVFCEEGVFSSARCTLVVHHQMHAEFALFNATRELWACGFLLLLSVT